MRPSAGWILAAVLLAGCEALPEFLDREPPVVAPTKPVAQSPSPSAAPTAEVEAGTLEAPVAALPPVNDDPDQFLGSSGSDIAAVLGEPGLRRKEGPAEIWQYRGRNCVLDLFLYLPENGTGSARVDYVELRNPALSETKRRACLADMLRAQLAPVS